MEVASLFGGHDDDDDDDDDADDDGDVDKCTVVRWLLVNVFLLQLSALLGYGLWLRLQMCQSFLGDDHSYTGSM